MDDNSKDYEGGFYEQSKSCSRVWESQFRQRVSCAAMDAGCQYGHIQSLILKFVTPMLTALTVIGTEQSRSGAVEPIAGPARVLGGASSLGPCQTGR